MRDAPRRVEVTFSPPSFSHSLSLPSPLSRFLSPSLLLFLFFFFPFRVDKYLCPTVYRSRFNNDLERGDLGDTLSPRLRTWAGPGILSLRGLLLNILRHSSARFFSPVGAA